MTDFDRVSGMPVWSGFLSPILQVLSDGGTWRKRELHEAVANHLALTDDQRAEVLSSGQRRVDNRIGWVLSGLNRAELVSKPERATFTITMQVALILRVWMRRF